MKTMDFYRERAELYAESIEKEYGVQRENAGKYYVNDPFPTKEDYLRRFKSDLDDPSEELDDFDDLSDEENEKMVEEAVELVAKAYDEVARERAEFLKPIDKKIKDAETKRDTYLESLRETIEVCDLVIQNAQVFSNDRVLQAQKLRKETEENIRKREAVLQKESER